MKTYNPENSFQNDVFNSDHPERFVPRADYEPSNPGREANTSNQYEDLAEDILGKIPANLPRAKQHALNGIPTNEERRKNREAGKVRNEGDYKNHGVYNKRKKVIF